MIAVNFLAYLNVMVMVASFLATPATQPDEKVVTITGGHDTDAGDRGRPVVLVAAGLDVPPEVFRKAFSKVKPAGPERGPTEDEARRNKDALLGELSKYGVTNDRLDEVSNYYRYRRESGEIWKHREAKVMAILRDGQVSGFRIDDPGAGYSSPPILSMGTKQLKAIVTLHFITDLSKNGSIEKIELQR